MAQDQTLMGDLFIPKNSVETDDLFNSMDPLITFKAMKLPILKTFNSALSF